MQKELTRNAITVVERLKEKGGQARREGGSRSCGFEAQGPVKAIRSYFKINNQYISFYYTKKH